MIENLGSKTDDKVKTAKEKSITIAKRKKPSNSEEINNEKASIDEIDQIKSPASSINDLF